MNKTKTKKTNAYASLRWAASLAMALTIGVFASCEESNDVGASNIDTTPYAPASELDQWIYDNYTKPYNIEITYLWEEYETDLSVVLYPPSEQNVQPLLKIMKTIWIDPYNALGGEDFIKRIAPRRFVLIGGYSYNSNGTITLGIADSGAKVSLFNVNQLDTTNTPLVKQYFKTVQHEYVHILNQTVPFDPAFGRVNPENFRGDWFNSSDTEARQLGFITAYARANAREDFAEMVSEMLTHSKDDFDDIVNNIAGADSLEARAQIREKENIVVNYYKSAFDIDLYALQALVEENTIAATRVDATGTRTEENEEGL